MTEKRLKEIEIFFPSDIALELIAEVRRLQAENEDNRKMRLANGTSLQHETEDHRVTKKQLNVCREELRRLQAEQHSDEEDPVSVGFEAICQDCGATPGDGLTQGWWCLYCKKGIPSE